VSRTNTWYVAICTQLRATNQPLVADQIWQGMVQAGFQHTSTAPRSTLRARLAELVQMKKIARVGPTTYQLAEEPS
jgi:hypothetical protein